MGEDRKNGQEKDRREKIGRGERERRENEVERHRRE